MGRVQRSASAVVLALVVAACGHDGAPAPRPAGGVSGTVRVFAAASLTEAFTALGETFETDHPGVRVAFNFAASSALAQQIDGGADADVFASADEASMQEVIDAGEARDAKPFVRNRLAILVERDNPKRITGLAGTTKPGVVLVLCAPEVPCGKYAAAAYAKAGLAPKPASLEDNVKGVVTKVTLGEADAGIVYATDAKAAGSRATSVPVEHAADPDLEAVYPVAVLRGTANRVAAEAWVEFLRSAAAQRALARLGFLPPR